MQYGRIVKSLYERYQVRARLFMNFRAFFAGLESTSSNAFAVEAPSMTGWSAGGNARSACQKQTWMASIRLTIVSQQIVNDCPAP